MRFTPGFATLLGSLALAVTGVSESSGQDGKPIPEKELPRFLGPVSPDQFTWRVVNGPDFQVYYGKANPPLAGSVGFYFGGFPEDLKPGQTTLKSRLGNFQVKWERSVDANGSISQEGIFLVDGLWLTAHVWASAPNQNQLDDLLSVVGRLPTFASGAIPERFEEIHNILVEEQRTRRVSWICWWALFIAVAWVADRICRGRQISAAGRLLAFAGVIPFMMAATIGGVAASSHVGILWFHKASMRLLFYAAGALCALALLLGSGLFLIGLFRTRNRGRNPTAG
jgi:hypothetical protein